MRKLILALMALACLAAPVAAQQAPTSTADQGRPGTAAWPVSWTGQSVFADLRVAGAAVTAGNPVPVSVSNFPATQAVTQSGSWTFGLSAPIPAGGNAIGSVLADLRVGGAAVSTGNTVPASANVTSGSGGIQLVSRLVSSAATTNSANVKASAGRLYKVYGYNAAASIRWLHFYNGAGVATVGTTPVYFSVPMPPGPFSFDGDSLGLYFSGGIAYSLTTGSADSDTTAVAAGDILNLTFWYQ